MPAASSAETTSELDAGLSLADAAQRLIDTGPNELGQQRQRGLLDVIWEVVPGDILLLNEGARVMAGTLVTSGQGVVRVEATGARTEFGRIGASLQTVALSHSPLKEDMARLTRRLDVAAHGDAPLPEAFHELLEFAVLASEIDPHDPMEAAFHRMAGRTSQDTDHLHPQWTLSREYELSPELMAMSHLWRQAGHHEDTVATKGAPEAVAEALPDAQHDFDFTCPSWPWPCCP